MPRRNGYLPRAVVMLADQIRAIVSKCTFTTLDWQPCRLLHSIADLTSCSFSNSGKSLFSASFMVASKCAWTPSVRNERTTPRDTSSAALLKDAGLVSRLYIRRFPPACCELSQVRYLTVSKWGDSTSAVHHGPASRPGPRPGVLLCLRFIAANAKGRSSTPVRWGR